MEKEQRKLTETYADRIPFVGMPDKYINYTLAGKPSNIKTEKGNYQNQGYSAKNTYIWNGSDGYIALKAESKDGIITFVEKYNEKYYWTSDGKPNFSASLPKKRKYTVTPRRAAIKKRTRTTPKITVRMRIFTKITKKSLTVLTMPKVIMKNTGNKL